MEDFIKDILDPFWWLRNVIIVLLLAFIAHYFIKRYEKWNIKTDEKRKVEKRKQLEEENKKIELLKEEPTKLIVFLITEYRIYFHRLAISVSVAIFGFFGLLISAIIQRFPMFVSTGVKTWSAVPNVFYLDWFLLLMNIGFSYAMILGAIKFYRFRKRRLTFLNRMVRSYLNI